MDGLLGVAGMMTLLVMTGIIPENSLLSTSKSLCGVYLAEKKTCINRIYHNPGVTRSLAGRHMCGLGQTRQDVDALSSYIICYGVVIC